MDKRPPLSASDTALLIGGIALFVYVGFFIGLDIFNVNLNDDDFIIQLTPYILLLGLILFGSGIGYKIYKWKH